MSKLGANLEHIIKFTELNPTTAGGRLKKIALLRISIKVLTRGNEKR